MLINHVYYALKPVMPLRLRLALRRLRARSIQKRCGSYWPILEASGNSPEGWLGWPDKKEFAFVLTHDVEGLKGLNRCRQLAEIEMEFGFRSSFNFIPNGEYIVPDDLLAWLRQNGFEIGVHDYRHDGTLFRTRESFQRDTAAINRQLKDWGAVGFRAGFMLHKLDWLHDLHIAYDSSTFDVDPFEPQQDGAQTIFPFWVPRPDPAADAFPHQSADNVTQADQQGYIELPYTLVQDYNLFVVLKQRGIDIWKRKLRWLAEKGGMAMLDTHPDYMAMAGNTPSTFEFPVQYYRDFLKHVSTEYADRYWAALPHEAAAYCRPFRPKQSRPVRHVAMLVYSNYSNDNRVRRYAETLARRGDQVRVFCLGKADKVKARQWETMNGVKVLRLQSRSTAEAGKWLPAWRLSRFFLRALSQLSPKNLPDGCDLLHVHNIPDFLVFAGIRLKFRGTPIILDIHDIVPELYESKFTQGRFSLFAAGLRRIEKWSCRFANHVIIANHIWKKTLIERSLPAHRLTALVNNVDLDLFSRKTRTRTDDRIILLYPGTLNHHQGLDIAIEAMDGLSRDFPKIELHIYGRGPSLPKLKEQVSRLKLTEHVKFFDGILIDEVSTLMANADIGIVPKRAEGFGDQAYSTKIMEFMSQSLPVVLSRTRIDSLYFNDSVAAFFESGNSNDLARAVREILNNPAYRQQLSEQGYAYAQANSWEAMKNVYLDVVDRLTTTALPRQETAQPQTTETGPS
jgi:glycosyltransferase involved in cell wall biosynthesis